MIAKRAQKTGDGSHFLSHDEAHKNSIWGFGDKDIDIDEQIILDQMNNWEYIKFRIEKKIL